METVRHISTSIARQPGEVFDFASNGMNLPRWAAGLAKSELDQDGDAWIANAPFGRVKIRFSLCKRCGVMDHDVELEDGTMIHNPMRVVPHGAGSEFIFTLIRQPGMDDEAFENDANAIIADLATLKKLLEAPST